jgi:hypothetical protein
MPYMSTNKALVMAAAKGICTSNMNVVAQVLHAKPLPKQGTIRLSQN